MACALARAYTGSEGVAPSGVQGQRPEADDIFALTGQFKQ